MLLASAAFVCYTLSSYPFLLALFARRGGQPIQRSWEPKGVSLLLAVRNGEAWIHRKLSSILQLNYPRELVEILVVSDGSTDRTEDYVRQFEPQGVQLFRIPWGGKTTALKSSIEQGA